MHITRSKELTVRMGDYESFKFRAEVGVTHRDFGVSDHDETTIPADVVQSMHDFLTTQLDAALQSDIDDAVELTQDRNSFLAQAFRPAPLSRSTATRRKNR